MVLRPFEKCHVLGAEFNTLKPALSVDVACDKSLETEGFLFRALVPSSPG